MFVAVSCFLLVIIVSSSFAEWKKIQLFKFSCIFSTIRHPRFKKACDRSGMAPIKAAMGWLNEVIAQSSWFFSTRWCWPEEAVLWAGAGTYSLSAHMFSTSNLDWRRFQFFWFYIVIQWFSFLQTWRQAENDRNCILQTLHVVTILLLGLCLQGYGHSLKLLISSHSHSLWFLVLFTGDGSKKAHQLAAVWLSHIVKLCFLLGWLLFSSLAVSMNQCSVILTRALPCQHGPRNWPVTKQNATVSESFPILMVLHVHASFVATGQQPWWQQTRSHVDICSKKELFCPSFRMCCSVVHV